MCEPIAVSSSGHEDPREIDEEGPFALPLHFGRIGSQFLGVRNAAIFRQQAFEEPHLLLVSLSLFTLFLPLPLLSLSATLHLHHRGSTVCSSGCCGCCGCSRGGGCCSFSCLGVCSCGCCGWCGERFVLRSGCCYSGGVVLYGLSDSDGFGFCDCRIGCRRGCCGCCGWCG